MLTPTKSTRAAAPIASCKGAQQTPARRPAGSIVLGEFLVSSWDWSGQPRAVQSIVLHSRSFSRVCVGVSARPTAILGRKGVTEPRDPLLAEIKLPWQHQPPWQTSLSLRKVKSVRHSSYPIVRLNAWQRHFPVTLCSQQSHDIHILNGPIRDSKCSK